MAAIKQQMIKRLAVLVAVIVLLCSIAYAGLLTNWFRYGLSLETTYVIVPLVIGAFISLLFALVAYIKGSDSSLFVAVVVAVVGSGLVITAQMHSFGHMPSLFAKHIEKSPVGHLATPQGALEYWIELENPFAGSHREYLLVARGHEHFRIAVPIFDAPAGAFASPLIVTDWGRLTTTSNPNIVVLTLGPHLMREGRFEINLAMRKAERR